MKIIARRFWSFQVTADNTDEKSLQHKPQLCLCCRKLTMSQRHVHKLDKPKIKVDWVELIIEKIVGDVARGDKKENEPSLDWHAMRVYQFGRAHSTWRRVTLFSRNIFKSLSLLNSSCARQGLLFKIALRAFRCRGNSSKRVIYNRYRS